MISKILSSHWGNFNLLFDSPILSYIFSSGKRHVKKFGNHWF